jgi:hypothetical protein
MATHREYVAIGRGLAGWHAKGVSQEGHEVSSSGGTFAGYVAQAVDGALVYDGQEADEDAFTAFVIRGPMIGPKLPAGSVHRFTDHGTAAAMLPGLSDEFAALASMAQAPEFSGFDLVAPDVYRALLVARVPGVKVGTVRGGAVVWDELSAVTAEA